MDGITTLRIHLDRLALKVEKELTKGRSAGDTHDFSSSGYNAYDDGYISGVYEATEQLGDAIVNDPQTPPQDGELLTGRDILRMRLSGETVEDVIIQDGAMQLRFANGDRLRFLFWEHGQE